MTRTSRNHHPHRRLILEQLEERVMLSGFPLADPADGDQIAQPDDQAPILVAIASAEGMDDASAADGLVVQSSPAALNASHQQAESSHLDDDIDLNTGTGTGPDGVIRILGDDGGDESGHSVSSAGDVNGDGYDDFLIGAYYADPAGGNEAGETCLVFGHGDAWSDINLDTGTGTGPSGVIRIFGDDEGDQSGWSVSPAGDVDGDGYDDFLIGARYADPPGVNVGGEVYLVFGHGGAWSDIDFNGVVSTETAVRILGDDQNDYCGYSVCAAGDVNNDGYDDFLIGARGADPPGGTEAGETYLVFGHSGPWSNIDLNTGTGTGPTGVIRILGDDAYDMDGLSARSASAGDVNGDGYDDFLIGASQADPAGGDEAGETYIVFGHGGAWSDIDLNTGTGTGPAGVIRIFGDDAGDYSGFWVSGGGDVNNDGYDDFLIGAPGADAPGGSGAGETYLVFGHGGSWSDINLNTGTGTGPTGVIRIFGDDPSDSIGEAASSAGDVDGDGYDDLLIGSRVADPPGGGSAGETYLVFGHGGSWSDIDLNTGTGTGPTGVIRILGDDAGDYSFMCAFAGDVNGDGGDDFLIGASDADRVGDDHAGEACLIFGLPNAVATATAGNPVTFTDADGDTVTVSVSGPGRIDVEFTGATPDGSDIADADITGGGGSSDFAFTYTGGGNGVQITNLLDVVSPFDSVLVEGDVNDLQVAGSIASSVRIEDGGDGTLSSGSIGWDVRGDMVVDALDGELTVGDDVESSGSVQIGTLAEDGVLRVGDDIRGEVRITGDAEGEILVGDDVRSEVRVDGALSGRIAAAGYINRIKAGDIDGAEITAGFDPDTGLPTGQVGDVRKIVMLSSDIIDATIAATHGLFYNSATGTVGRLSTSGGGVISGVVFSAGFGPGVDGEFGTGDDVVLSSGRMGNVGSNSARFADINGHFQAGGRMYDFNSATDVTGMYLSLGDIDDLRAGGRLSANIVAGDDIDSISVGNIQAATFLAGFNWDFGAGVISPSGMRGDIRRITVTSGDIVTTRIIASDDILYDDGTGAAATLQGHGGAMSSVTFSAGFGPGPDGVFGTSDDVVLNAGRIGNIGSASTRFANIDGMFLASGRMYDFNTAGNLGEPEDLILSLGDIDDLRVGDTLRAIVIAGDDVDSITAANITETLIVAGFNVDFDTEEFSPSGFQGDIRRITLTGSDITDAVIAASDDILYTDGPQTLTGSGTISNAIVSAGFGPGPDQDLGTSDDVILSTDGRLGNIGSSGSPFAQIDGLFLATGRMYDFNSAGDLGVPEDLILSLGDTDDLRAGGDLRAHVVAGDDIDSVTAANITDTVIVAGFNVDLDTGDFTPSGMSGDIRKMTLTGSDITTALIVASDDILYDDATGSVGALLGHGGTISDGAFWAGFGPGADGEFGTGDDVVLGDGRIGNIGSSSSRFANIDGTFAAGGRMYDFNTSGDLGNSEDAIVSLGDIDDLRVGGDLRAYIIAGDDIDSITAANIVNTAIVAGFDVDFDTERFTPSGMSGDIRRMTLTGSDITNAMIVASDDIFYASSPQRLTGTGTISDTLFSAGFGPGPDGRFETNDDVVVNADGRIGNIGSASNRFAVIDGYFRATGNIYDLNAAGAISANVWSMNDVDDVRAGGMLSGTIAAGDDIDSILADLITSPLISAGYAPGADGEFTWGGDDVLSGMAGDIRSVETTGDITANFRASRDILSIRSGGILGTAALGDDWIFAGDDIGILRSVSDIGAAIAAGTLSDSGLIGRIEVNEPDDLGGPDPTILDTVFANLGIDLVRVEGATPIDNRFTGMSPDTLILDTDTDGA